MWAMSYGSSTIAFPQLLLWNSYLKQHLTGQPVKNVLSRRVFARLECLLGGVLMYLNLAKQR